jgi:hypothetical protein
MDELAGVAAVLIILLGVVGLVAWMIAALWLVSACWGMLVAAAGQRRATRHRAEPVVK